MRSRSTRWPATPVTASVGIALSRLDDDLGSLLRRADAEAYAAKRAGGNRISICRDDDDAIPLRPSQQLGVARETA